MSNFFVDDKIYKDRLDICRECPMLFKPTMSCKRCGCFMKVKAKIGRMSCPDKHWLPVNPKECTTDIPKQLIQECIDIMPKLKGGVADSQQTKKRMIELYNTIFNTHFNPSTNCSSCISTCYSGVKKIAKENS
tara:strand:- start:1707 stop:2105 length:399 start_codon:yes stop_codon:yes gene_type:complete